MKNYILDKYTNVAFSPEDFSVRRLKIMVRSRLVARDFKGNGKGRDDLFVDTPPLEAKKMIFSTLETRGTPCSTWTGSRRTAGRRLAATRRCGRGMVLSSSPSHHRILWIFSVLMIAAVTATVAQVRLLVFPGHIGALTDPVLSRSLSLCRGLGRSRLQC